MAMVIIRQKSRHLLVFCVIILLLDIIYCDSSSSTCEQQCGQSDLVEGDSWQCNQDCRKQKCAAGCQLWRSALEDNCLQACSKSGFTYNEQQYCSTGCNIAIDSYAERVKQELRGLSKPSLVPNKGSRTNHSVLLSWPQPSAPSAVVALAYKLQKDYIEHPLGWQYHDDITWTQGHRRLVVLGLRPYVTYKFRMLVVISSRHTVISPESLPIATAPYGPPSSPPTILSLSSSATSIHAKWRPPVFKNGMLTNYRFEVTRIGGGGGGSSTFYSTPPTGGTSSSSVHKLKEIPAARDLNAAMSEVMTLLTPNTDYRVTIAAVNLYGVGPGATRVIRTQAESIAEGISPYLVLGADNKILRRNLDDLFSSESILFRAHNASTLILGASIDYARRLIYFSDTTGRVWRLNVSTAAGGGGGGPRRTDDPAVTLVYRSTLHPRALATDWLHQKLYVTEDRQISQCELDSFDCKPVITSLSSRPEDVKVDPCNGYLYWTQHGVGRGLFRIDLADLTQPHLHLAGSLAQYLIVSTDMLTTLTIDYLNYRLFLPDDRNNTIQSYYLDGKDKYDIRQDRQTASYIAVKSIVSYGGHFYWITQDGENETVIKEDIYEGRVYHNDMFFKENHFAGLNIWHPTAQPVPVPLLTPKKLQALFAAETALIEWNETDTDQGRGAWREWQYEVEISALQVWGRGDVGARASNLTYRDLRTTSLRIRGLVPDTVYQVRVRAYSSGGYGPWSEGFRAATLKNGKVLPTLAVVGEAAIYKVPLDGGAPVQAILNHTVLTGVNDLEVYRDLELMWSMDNGVIYRKLVGQPIKILPEINNAGAIAYDWLAHTLYWASITHTNMILRSVLSSPMRPETVIQELAGYKIQDITLDPVEGYIYWTTLHSIGASRLDGSEYSAIVNVMPNFGKYILGLALDSEKGLLYWLENDVNEMVLYSMGLLRRHDSASSHRAPSNTVMVHSFTSKAMYQSIQLYSDKLIWQIWPEEMMVLDIRGKSLARMVIDTPGERLTAFALRHPDMYKYPAGLNETSVEVVPAAVEPGSVSLDGDWDHFNISWRGSTTNHGDVYYKVLMEYNQNGEAEEVSRESRVAWLIVNRDLLPYTTVTCTIKACTHWGCSQPSLKSFTTPMAAPSEPQRPRVFVTHHRHYAARSINVELDFCWDAPEQPNGILSGYEVLSSSSPSVSGGSWQRSLYNNRTLHHSLANADHNALYYFRVRACTNDCGDYTSTVTADTTVEHPVPRLLTSTPNSIRLFYPDEHKSQELTPASGATSIAFIAHESTIYWLDKRGYIMKQTMKETTEVVAVNGTGRDLTADWIGRDLYWLVQKPSGLSDIMKYDLNKNNGKPLLVLTRVTVLWKMAINPYQSTIYWTETNPDGIGTMMMCKKDGTGVRPLLNGGGRRRRKKKKSRRKRPRQPRAARYARAVPEEEEEDEICTCPEFSVSPVFVLDHTNRSEPEIFMVEQGSSSIWGADLDGCHCRLIINGSAEIGLPPDSLTVDHERLYWSSADQKVVNSVLKADGTGFMNETSGDVNNIIAYGEHLQPMPDTACLMLSSKPGEPVLVKSSNISLTLRLNDTPSDDTVILSDDLDSPGEECTGISTPTMRRSVHYRPVGSQQIDQRSCTSPGVSCDVQDSFDEEFIVEGLNPYTMYVVQVALSNFYMDNMNIRPSLGPLQVFSTKAGIPSPPQDVAAEPSLPVTANVTWRLPEQINGRPSDIIYIIDWHTFNADGSKLRGTLGGSAGEQPKPSNVAENMYMMVPNLHAAQRYYFRVLAYDKDMTGYSASRTVTTVMYQYPGPIQLVESTQTSITVSWTSPSDDSIHRHSFEFAKWDDNAKLQFQLPKYNNNLDETHTSNYTTYNMTFERLQANQYYAFCMSVIYKKHFQHFYWPTIDDVRYKYKTAAAVPSAPEPPFNRATSSGLYMVTWERPYDGGDPIKLYELQARPNESGETTGNWSTVYNGSEPHWGIEGLEEDQIYSFRVRALNGIGWSPYSDNSTDIIFAAWMQAPVSNHRLTIILVSCFSVLAILVFACLIIFALVYLPRYKDRKMIPGFHFVAGLRGGGHDLELATLRELPRMTRQQANALYAINIVPTKEDIAALPHFRRDQLTLTKFLGSGAFGEVFEGLARNIITAEPGETKVAVKTLRKGASEQEKEEFLKEALLMSNFKHEHILRLLGVCLDNDPQFIILELMEGGDLLSYLRNARPTTSNTAKLFLPGMVGICVDVSRGCRYLEEMHFVHRDLAARNCLVSNGYRERVVKIGDFGLARDIYKNDYYRKEGEGLLPVRWMSPESLIDGVFTTQSDVWAFGVLMWEVLTLGQQPYPARTNLEVLHFVRSGGRLDRPDVCPDEMYSLMYKCWMYNPEERPSFHYILEQLEHFKELCSDPSSEFSGLVPIASNIHRPPTRRERLMAFLTGGSPGGSDSDGASEKTPPLKKPGIRHSPPFDVRTRCNKEAEASGYLEPLVQAPQDKHRYLELLDDNIKLSTPKKMQTQPGGVTYAQLAGSDHEDDDEDDEDDSKGRRGKYDRSGRLRRNHMSPPKEQDPTSPTGTGGRFVFTPPDARNKTGAGNHSDLTGLGTNHWPQNNIPALPLPPPRECKFLRDPQNERMRPRDGKRRSSSLNARPLKRERERAEAAAASHDDDSGGRGRIYPSRSELRKNPFVEDVGPRTGARGRGRGRGATRSQSAGRQEAKSRANGTESHKLAMMESNC